MQSLDFPAALSTAIADCRLLSDRRTIIRRLAEAEAAADSRRRAESRVQELESELEYLVQRHQDDAMDLQKRILDSSSPEERAELRAKLQEWNSNLQDQCDKINREIEVVTAVKNEFFLTESTASFLKKRLHELAPESKLIDLQVAENTARWAQARVKEAEKRLAEVQSTHRAGGWTKSGSQASEPSPEVARAIAVAQRESLTAEAIASEAASEVARLRAEIEN